LFDYSASGASAAVAGAWVGDYQATVPSAEGRWQQTSVRALVQSGCVPDLVAYSAGEPVAWCSVAPREEYPALQRSPSRKAVDAEPVWSITCLYVARSHRRQHLTHQLIDAAVAYVRDRRGRIIEAYPVPPKRGVASTNYAFTGFVSTFEKAGFTECLRRSRTRSILRCKIRPPKTASRRI
jgi:GNAT superfamily N-acetyltransferase